MTFDSTLFDPAQLYLEITPSAQEQAWQFSRSFATSTSQWNAYLNQLCLATVLNWLQEDYGQRAGLYPNSAAPNR